MLITIEDFNTYTDNFNDAPDVVNMKNDFIETAQEVVSNYLGYSVEETNHDEYLYGMGDPTLYLYGMPITKVNSISISGSAVSSDSYTISGRTLRLNDGVWPLGLANIHCNYDAGWTAENAPKIIKDTIKQIGSLLLQEVGGNIGVTGKSMSENSRTYINYTNFSKWLQKLDAYVVKRMV